MEREAAYGTSVTRDLKLVVALGRCMQSMSRRLFPSIASGGFTPAQFTVMEMLYHKGPLTVNEVIAKTLSSSGNIGVVIQNLIRMGCVTKSTDPADRRVRHVGLTGPGRKKIAAYFPEHLREVEQALSCLTANEKEQLTSLLKKLGRQI